jgi:hypothetical protein
MNRFLNNIAKFKAYLNFYNILEFIKADECNQISKCYATKNNDSHAVQENISTFKETFNFKALKINTIQATLIYLLIFSHIFELSDI